MKNDSDYEKKEATQISQAALLNILEDLYDTKEALRKAKDELEIRVRERTAELKKVNEKLRLEISELKQAEEELRESEEKYQSLVESTEDSIYLLDRKCRYLFMNKKHLSMLGLEAKKAKGRTYAEFHSEDETKDLIGKAEKVFETGKSLYYEHRSQRDGRYFLRTLSPVKETDGSSKAITVISKDISELKEAEDALRESEEKYRTILENIEDAYYEVDIAGNFTFFNDSLCKISGYTKDELIGMNNRQYMDQENAKKVYRAFNKVYNTGKPEKGFDYKFIRKDGNKGHANASISLMKDAEGQRIGFRGIIRDITQRKRAEEELKHYVDELERSNQELEQFAYIASHDLQEPLRMVASYTQLLVRRYKGKLDSDADEFIAYAVDGATRMQDLINDLLTYSRIGTRGKDFEPTDCEAVFDRTLGNLQKAIEESGAKVTHDPLPTVMADDMQLGQLFQNLIGNAIKFRSEEPPSIHVSCERIGKSAIGNPQSAMNKAWVFSVRDNGIGIDPEFTGRIFIIFQRLHKRREYPGTGIGLAVCKKIVERHGGRIWVESQPGKGSTFYFTIPLRGENSHG